MPGLRSRQMKLPLQIGSSNVDVAHRHLGIDMPEQLHERRQAHPCAYHLTGICMPELVRNDAGGDTDRSDNIGKVRTELFYKRLLVARAGQEPAVQREWVERTEKAQTMDDLTNKRVHRDHPLGLQLPEGNVNGPPIRAGIVEAIVGKINTFPDAHSGVADEQQDIGGQIIATEQFLLNQLILLRRQGAWQPLRSARNVLATDQVGQVGDLRAPGKLFQHAAHKQQACDVDRGHQVLGAQIDKPAENVGIAAQLMERHNSRMLLTKIDQKGAGDGTILTNRRRREGGSQRVNRSLELLHQRMFQRSITAGFHDVLPGTGLMCCATAFAYC
jgi:hypothetical protein